MTLVTLISSFADVATTLGVLCAVYQLWLTKKLAKESFEDSFDDDYRQIISKIPMDALLGKELSSSVLETHLIYFYLYFDLCNGQLSLKNSAVDEVVLERWKEGIIANCNSPAFQQALIRIGNDKIKKDFSCLSTQINEANVKSC